MPGSKVGVQPDAWEQVFIGEETVITMPAHFVLLEAKRIRRAAFQLEQLAREYVTLLDRAE